MLVSHPELRVNFTASSLGCCWGLVWFQPVNWVLVIFFHLFAVFSSWILSVTGCCVHASLGNRVVSWAVGKKHVMAWCPACASATLRAGWSAPVTLQSDRVLWMHRGLQFVDTLGHNKCICESCSIMLSPVIVYGVHFFQTTVALQKAVQGPVPRLWAPQPWSWCVREAPINVSCVNVSPSVPPPSLLLSLKSLQEMSSGED